LNQIKAIKIGAKTTGHGVGMKTIDISDFNLRSPVQSLNLKPSSIYAKGKLLTASAEKTLEAEQFIAAHQALIADLKNQIKESTDHTNAALSALFKNHNKIVDSCQEQIILSSSLINCYFKVNRCSKSPSTEIALILNNLVLKSISVFNGCKEYLKKYLVS